MNIPNALTLSRFIMSVAFVISLLKPGVTAAVWALSFFLLASLTDWADGYLARKLDQISTFGKIADPVADKVLTLSAFFVLSLQGVFAMWMVLLVCFREVAVTLSRFKRMRQGKVIAAERSGKIKTVVQFVTIILALILRVFWVMSGTPTLIKDLEYVWRSGLHGLMIVTVFLTLWSGMEYWKGVRKNKDADEFQQAQTV